MVISLLRLRFFFLNFCYTVVINILPGTFHFLTEPGIFCCVSAIFMEATTCMAMQSSRLQMYTRQALDSQRSTRLTNSGSTPKAKYMQHAPMEQGTQKLL